MKAAVVCALFAALSSSAQQVGAPAMPDMDGGRLGGAPDAVGSGTIRGRVVRADTRQPLARVQVTASNGADARVATSGTDGRFELAGMPAGSYRLVARHNGFVTLSYGQHRVGDTGRRVEVRPDRIVDDVDFALPKGGMIDGIVVDDAGEPVPAVAVTLVRHAFFDGERRLAPWSVEPGYSDLTDDLGRFRLFGLLPGTYFLAADGGSESGGVRLEAATFYPGTTADGDPRPIEIAAGTELSGLSMQLVPAETAPIRGVLIGSAGTDGRNVSLVRHTQLGDIVMGQFSVRPDGSFVSRPMPLDRTRSSHETGTLSGSPASSTVARTWSWRCR